MIYYVEDDDNIRDIVYTHLINQDLKHRGCGTRTSFMQRVKRKWRN